MSVDLSVVVPAFNEASRIAHSLEQLRTYLPSIVQTWEIRVVDDGSTDATAKVVREIAATDGRVMLHTEPHRGKGAAVRAGMLAATAERRFMCDADLSMPLHEVPRFLEAGKRADVVIGAREGQGAVRIGEPIHRHLMGRAFNALVRAAIGLDINDTQCGFKLFSARAADAIFQRAAIDGWAFDVEALCIARRRGFRIVELPIEWHYGERSHVSPLTDSVRMARDVVTILRNARNGRYE